MSQTKDAGNAALYIESAQSLVAMAELTDSGDAKLFTSGATLWSGKSGYTPTVRPNGLVTGGVVSVAASGSNDVVDVAALTCYLAGSLVSVSADTDVALTRATSTDTHIINSITITSAGAIAVVVGTDNTSFSATRGAAGGPPWIPTGSIEIAQVRLTSYTAAAVVAAEIFQVPGAHLERYDYPVWKENMYGGSVEFAAALGEIHSDDSGTTTAPKKVYAEYYTPSFSELYPVKDFVPPENSHSVNSEQYYQTTVASKSSSLNQGSFVMGCKDGITDMAVALKDEFLWFKFYPDKDGAPYNLSQGTLGISRTFPADGTIQANCTISATEEGNDIAS